MEYETKEGFFIRAPFSWFEDPEAYRHELVEDMRAKVERIRADIEQLQATLKREYNIV